MTTPSKPETSRTDELRRRYLAAMHGCQSATAFLLGSGDEFASPKHLRTGVSACMVDAGAVATLLIRKGIITEVEYHEAILAMAERELASLTERARERSGIPHLHFA